MNPPTIFPRAMKRRPAPKPVSVTEPYVSLEEVARRLGVTRYTAWRWYDQGKLRGVKLGRKIVRIPESAIQEFVNAHTK